MTGFVRRYGNDCRVLKDFIDNGYFGDTYYAKATYLRRAGSPGGWFGDKARSGGGPLIDLGVHMIDLTLWLMGNPTPTAVSACTYRKFADTHMSDSVHSTFGEANADGTFDVEDLAMGFIRFDNGACMQIEFSWASNIEREKRFFELRGMKAGAEWNDCDNRLKIFGEAYGQTVDLLPNIDNAAVRIHEANLRHFVDVVLNGAEPMFVPQQGVNMVKILEAMYQSAEAGREIAL